MKKSFILIVLLLFAAIACNNTNDKIAETRYEQLLKKYQHITYSGTTLVSSSYHDKDLGSTVDETYGFDILHPQDNPRATITVTKNPERAGYDDKVFFRLCFSCVSNTDKVRETLSATALVFKDAELTHFNNPDPSISRPFTIKTFRKDLDLFKQNINESGIFTVTLHDASEHENPKTISFDFSNIDSPKASWTAITKIDYVKEFNVVRTHISSESRQIELNPEKLDGLEIEYK